MTIAEQIKDGQHRANQIVKQAKFAAEDLEKYPIALFIFIEELESGIEQLRSKFIDNEKTDSHAA